jgi:hypothetical protein
MDEEFGFDFTANDVAPPPPPPPETTALDPDRFDRTPAPIRMSPRDYDLMVRMTMMEAGREPDEGQQGVASVILNRARSGRYGEGVYGVITRKGQFEPWGNSGTRAKMMSVDTDSDAYQKAKRNVDAIISGQAEDPTGGATHFLNKATSASRGDSAMNEGGWGRTMANQIKIGNHTFGNADAGSIGSGRAALAARAASGPRANVVGSPDAQTPGIGRSERVPLPPARPAGILGGSSDDTALDIDKQLRARLGQPETPKPGLDPKAGLNAPEDSSGGEDVSSLRTGGGILMGGAGGGGLGATKNALPPLGGIRLGQGVGAQSGPGAPTPGLQAAEAGTIAPLVPKPLQSALAPSIAPAPAAVAPVQIAAPAIAPPQIQAPQAASPIITRKEDLPGWGTPDGQGRNFGTPNLGPRPSLTAPTTPAPAMPVPAPTPAPQPRGILVGPPAGAANPAGSLLRPLAPAPSALPSNQAGIMASPPPVDPDRFARDVPGLAPTSLAGSASAPAAPGGGRSLADLAGVLSGGLHQAQQIAGGDTGRRKRSGSSLSSPSSPELQTGSLLQGGILASPQGGIDLSRYFGLLSGRGTS